MKPLKLIKAQRYPVREKYRKLLKPPKLGLHFVISDRPAKKHETMVLTSKVADHSSQDL